MVAAEAFVVRIPGEMYKEMVAHVAAGYPNEACGALGCKGGLVVKNYPTANAAEHPDDFSEIEPTVLLRITLDIEEYDGDTVYYHSHPQSEAYPSPRDIEYAKRSGYMYLIFSHHFYPDQPYARVFSIQDDETVVEGKIELV
jgi:[CysO sulfur-carrier protein]-S-L-cysteine hydrolase